MSTSPEQAAAARRIDAHHHLWHYTPQEFGWIGDDMRTLRRDFLPAQLTAELDRANVHAAVAVQARETLAETDWLLECARQSNRLAGVVGWVPLDSPDLPTVLDRYRSEPRLCSVREIAQGKPEGFLLRPEFQRGIAQLADAGLAYDVLVYADQLGEAAELVRQHPKQTFVLDHAAKPRIAHGELEPWRTDLHKLAALPNVSCKLSGLVTEADWQSWTPDALRPCLDCCLEAFGPDRLLAGSDWPVCLVATTYEWWWQTLAEYLSALSQAEQAAILGGNATRVYRLTE